MVIIKIQGLEINLENETLFTITINVNINPIIAGQMSRLLNNSDTRNDAQVATMVEITMAMAIISMRSTKNID